MIQFGIRTAYVHSAVSSNNNNDIYDHHHQGSQQEQQDKNRYIIKDNKNDNYKDKTHTMIPIEDLTITIVVHQGRQLAAKDRNMFGKAVSSDPYVKIDLLGKLYGTTKVQKKTLTPQWNNEKFVINIKAEQTIALALQSSIILSIWDYDQVSAHDSMGIVTIPVIDLLNYGASMDNILRKFYPVHTGPRSTGCKNATGELEVSCFINAKQVRNLIPGNVHPISTNEHTTIVIGLSWDIEHQQKIDMDASCVAISSTTGEILMKETVYYGNVCNSNQSIMHSGDELTGATVGDDETITCRLNDIPTDVGALYIILSIANETKTFSDIKSTRIRVYDANTKHPICQCVPNQGNNNNNSNLGNYTSLFFARLYRNKDNRKEWLLSPIEEGHPTARDFGNLVPQIKSYSRDIIPAIRTIDMNEKVAIMRKNGIIRISDYCHNDSQQIAPPTTTAASRSIGSTTTPSATPTTTPVLLPPPPPPSSNIDSMMSSNNKLPDWLTFGLAWDITNGVNIDLDASVICLDYQLQAIDTIYFRHLRSNDNAIIHCGDEREGDVIGDDEKVMLSLNSINPATHYIGIIVNSYSGQELDDVAAASCHLFDTRTNRDIAVYALTNCKPLDKHTALVMACIYRQNTHDNEWLLQIISEPAQGRTVNDNVDELQNYIRRNQKHMMSNIPLATTTQLPVIIVESEDEYNNENEIDLSIAPKMPQYVPHNVDEEIVVIPSHELPQYSNNNTPHRTF